MLDGLCLSLASFGCIVMCLVLHFVFDLFSGHRDDTTCVLAVDGSCVLLSCQVLCCTTYYLNMINSKCGLKVL